MPSDLPILRLPYSGVSRYCSSRRRINARFSAETPTAAQARGEILVMVGHWRVLTQWQRAAALAGRFLGDNPSDRELPKLRLEIAPRRPQAPPGTRCPSTWGGFDLADVIYKDGRSAVTWIVDNNFDSGHQVLTYVLPRQIKAPPAKGFTPIVESAEPTELLLTYIRTGPSDRTVPFVLENIPLP